MSNELVEETSKILHDYGVVQDFSTIVGIYQKIMLVVGIIEIIVIVTIIVSIISLKRKTTLLENRISRLEGTNNFLINSIQAINQKK